MKTKLVHCYMMKRAKEVEKVKFDLLVQDFEQMFSQGIRDFFGVDINDEGDLLRDNNYPEYFETFIAEYGWKFDQVTGD